MLALVGRLRSARTWTVADAPFCGCGAILGEPSRLTRPADDGTACWQTETSPQLASDSSAATGAATGETASTRSASAGR